MIWVGRLGAASVAGVGIAGMAVILANAALVGLATGMRAIIARFVGAGDNEAANHAVRQAFVIIVGYFIIIAAIGIFLAESIVEAFGVETDVASEGAAYLRVQFVGMITMFLLTFSQGTMQASGDTLTPMKMSIVARSVHAVLCPFFVLGWWIFPHLGVIGAATSNIMAQGVGGLIGLWILFTGRTRLRLSLKNWRLDPDIMWRMVKIGIPNMFMQIQQHLSNLVLVWFIAPFGTLALAGHTLWYRIDGMLATMTVGIGAGAGVLGGQNLGAKQPERAQKSGWVAAGFATVITVIGSVIILLWAEKLTNIFTTEPDLVKITSTFLRISAASFVVLGFNMVFMLFLTGVGATLPAFLIEVISTWGLLLPLVFLLTRFTDFGVYGIRWSIVARLIVGGTVFAVYFWLGKWKHKKV